MPQDSKTLLQAIRALDLAILDSGLYLNAYDNEEASAYYRSLVAERAALAATYTQQVAPLVKTDTDKSWVNTPWPWECEAD